MIYNYRFGGVFLIIVGLFEMMITPMILRHLWTKLPSSPHYGYLIRMTRLSGLIVVIVGCFLLLGGYR